MSNATKIITVIDNPYNERREEKQILIPVFPAGSWGAWLETRDLDSESWEKILRNGILFYGPDNQFGNRLQWGGYKRRILADQLSEEKDIDCPYSNFHGGPVNMLCGSYEEEN